MTGLRVFALAFARRDRLTVLWFVIGITLLYWSQAISVDGMYTTRRSFEQAAAAMGSNPAFLAMAGPARALDTTGGQVAWQASAFGAVLAGLMSMLLIGRHTRAEEESGRDELLRAGVVSRRTPMTAALVSAAVANALVGAALSASLVGYGLPVPGSLALGVGIAACGLAFAAVALLAAQVTSSTRATYGLTSSVIGGAYVLRAIGDVSGGTLSWLSPIGWYQAMHAYSGERWWPLMLLLALTAMLLLAAYVAFDARDFGAGLWSVRPGPTRAGPGLSTALGLTWRIQRGSIVGWATGMLLGGLAYGSIGDDVKSLIGNSPAVTELFAAGSTDLVGGFYATAGLMLALIATGFTTSSALRARSEEEDGRVEALVATAMSRSRWWRAHVAVSGAGSVVVLLSAGVGMGVGYGLVTGDWRRFVELVAATLVMTPGTLALGSVALLLVGLVPRWSSLAWVGLLLCGVVLLLGSALRLPSWLLGVSPFSHLSLFPTNRVPWDALVVILLVAVSLGAAAHAAFLRRDLACR